MSHYETLGVPKDADPQEIKRAYRRESRRHHPDRPGGDHDRMAAVNRAIAVLGDPQKRARYDQSGEDEKAPLPPFEAKARDIVAMVFMHLAEKAPDHEDLIDLVRTRIRADQKDIPKIIEQGEARAAKFEKKLQRLKYKGSGHNFLGDALQEQIAQIRDGIEQIKENAKAGDRAIELLEDFEWEADERPPPQAADPHDIIEAIAEMLRVRILTT